MSADNVGAKEGEDLRVVVLIWRACTIVSGRFERTKAAHVVGVRAVGMIQQLGRKVRIDEVRLMLQAF